MIKSSINEIGHLLKILFNAILKDEQFPLSWSEGLIIPIFKSGDGLDTNNYRGITISNCLGKVFTKILNARLIDFLIQNNIISKYQIGFMPGHRTADHLLLIRTLIDTFKRKRKSLYAS